MAENPEIEQMFVIFYKVSYKGKAEGGSTLFDKMTAWWTSDFKEKFNGGWGKKYSHTELLYVFNDRKMKMISSSSRDGGVREKDHTINNEAWVYVNVSSLGKDLAYRFEKGECGKNKGYDYSGILGFVAPVRDDPNEWFCSELTLRALQVAGCVNLGGYNASRISPNRLFELLHDKCGFVPGDPPDNLPRGTRQ